MLSNEYYDDETTNEFPWMVCNKRNIICINFILRIGAEHKGDHL